LASAAVLTSSAGAVTQGSGTINLSTRAGVVQYLASHGINARGVVVQRGLHNYAGPNCPGKGWTCTTAKRVLQIAATAPSSNTFVCSPTADATATPPDGCVIDQFSSTGTNTAVCQESSANQNANQSCQVRQVNTSGTNKLTITQAVNTGAGSSQSPTQYAGVIQENGSGANTVTLGQGITALVNQVDSSGTQTQEATQGVYISQSSGAGANTATVNQSQSLKAVAQKKPSLTQKQNTDDSVNTNVSLTQTSGAGANKATVNQSNVYVGNVQQATTASQQQGSSGASGEAEFFSQTSTGGVNTIGGKQSESQTQRADQISGSSTQLQYGPLWADPDQNGGGSGDKYTLGQSSTQNATSPDAQEDNEYAECQTDGNCTANQSITQNGTTSQNSCTGTFCDIGNSVTFNGEGGRSSDTCNSDTDDTNCVPPTGEGTPNPPPPPTAFTIIILDETG
jgi:hypothetical protein